MVHGLYDRMRVILSIMVCDFPMFTEFKVLRGNVDSITTNKNFINLGVLTRWMRFLGTARHVMFCMRVEVFGVKQKPGKISMILLCDYLQWKLRYLRNCFA